jgi:hypothetical protein
MRTKADIKVTLEHRIDGDKDTEYRILEIDGALEVYAEAVQYGRSTTIAASAGAFMPAEAARSIFERGYKVVAVAHTPPLRA